MERKIEKDVRNFLPAFCHFTERYQHTSLCILFGIVGCGVVCSQTVVFKALDDICNANVCVSKCCLCSHTYICIYFVNLNLIPTTILKGLKLFFFNIMW